jgi:primosomal protein N' (replication factor Y) (superfamily II helicase)
VVNNDFHSMYHTELADRMQFHYPPFHRIIKITVRGKDGTLVDVGSQHLAQQFRNHFTSRVLGPEYPTVARIRDEFHKNIMLKAERETSVGKMKEIIARYVLEFKTHPDFKKMRVVIDVDPS